METILLPVKAKHFKDSTFVMPCNCGLANAAKDFFKTYDVSEGVNDMDIKNVTYLHEEYTDVHYDQDYALAASHNFDDTLIRTITLSK